MPKTTATNKATGDVARAIREKIKAADAHRDKSKSPCMWEHWSGRICGLLDALRIIAEQGSKK